MDDSFSGKIAPSFHHPFSKFIEFILSGHRSKIQILYAFFREEKDSTSGGHEFQVASVVLVSLTQGTQGQGFFPLQLLRVSF